ncbi:tor signaling pathway regulator [Grosmannia clavigera kw1407]|uniref:Tor signaling pathway regulator n=1 Tax=Grosmannia clavigera (strain kw1407 / UAMH 11150) TaxID=655863 RepID=F0XHZ1_GROCL|nr:tor signaling pathway regulator [Grosmannia clavigera kw1407]EFX02922.1 tor signaling pathway regulator [Grosmannia clavigera kw1407]
MDNRGGRDQETERPQTLRAACAAADRQREAIERGTFSFGGGSSNSNGGYGSYGDAVMAALAAYEDCSARIEALALFSSNEGADDVATAHLPYLLVPYRVAEMVQRLPPPNPGTPAERRLVLRRAREAHERFLHLLDGYGLLAAPYATLLQTYADDPTHFSTVGGGGSGGGVARTATTGMGPAAALMDPAARRNAKIANFQAEKALRAKLDVLRQRQQERRARRRRQRQLIRDRDGENDDDIMGDAPPTQAVDQALEDESEDEGDEDDEVARELYLAQLAYCAHMAFQSLESLNREDELLAQAHISLSDASTLRRLQSSFGSSPTWAGAQGAGPLLTPDGKPRQPFTIMGSRAEMAKAVFRPGHNLPTMSIDDYLEEERRRGGIIEGGGPSSGLPAEPDEDNYEKADAETYKARAWDEFTEANPRGSGNTLNRG